VTAIVGASGSGKSTIVSLIARFWDVDSGSISIGGRDIRQMPLETLMQQVGFVLQNDRLFSQSIMENIRFGDKTASDEEVVQAAKAANCHTFISQLPDGYDTIYGAAGTHLSSGQCQRIALARAILKNAPIIVLDEATASQDAENEVWIQEVISRLTQNKTVILIAHRLNAVRNADQILVMEKGTIQERGRHEELLQADGIYTKLWNAYRKTQAWHMQREKEETAI
jgi:ATP-binding cassette subfamily B protein